MWLKEFLGQNTLYNFESNSALRHAYLLHLVSGYSLGFQIAKAYKPRDQRMKRGVRASASRFCYSLQASSFKEPLNHQNVGQVISAQVNCYPK